MTRQFCQLINIYMDTKKSNNISTYSKLIHITKFEFCLKFRERINICKQQKTIIYSNDASQNRYRLIPKQSACTPEPDLHVAVEQHGCSGVRIYRNRI